MKHVVVLLVALFSITFLMGGSCDSGDFTTGYFFCCDSTGVNCTSDPTQCPAGGCSTGQQSFLNGQNECAVLQTDASNNSCALFSRFAYYINIGCTGLFTESPAFPAPINVTATAQAAGSGIIELTWSPPPGVPLPPGASIVYTISSGLATGTEGFLIGDIAGPPFYDSSEPTGTLVFYTVSASYVFAGNIAQSGTPSLEVTATSP